MYKLLNEIILYVGMQASHLASVESRMINIDSTYCMPAWAWGGEREGGQDYLL